MSKKKDDDWPTFFGGRIPFSKREKSILHYGILFGIIGAIIALIFLGKDHKILAVLIIAVFIISGMLLGSKVSSSDK